MHARTQVTHTHTHKTMWPDIGTAIHFTKWNAVQRQNCMTKVSVITLNATCPKTFNDPNDDEDDNGTACTIEKPLNQLNLWSRYLFNAVPFELRLIEYHWKIEAIFETHSLSLFIVEILYARSWIVPPFFTEKKTDQVNEWYTHQKEEPQNCAVLSRSFVYMEHCECMNALNCRKQPSDKRPHKRTSRN